MKQFKICMLGAPAVGKTSLTTRFVEGRFSEDYVTTVGVKVDRKDVVLGEETSRLIVWDINGEDRFHHVQASYLKGASGALVVIDGTRRKTVETALELRQRLADVSGDVPVAVVLNKADLTEEWVVEPAEILDGLQAEVPIYTTSAKTGDGVEDAFHALAQEIRVR